MGIATGVIMGLSLLAQTAGQAQAASAQVEAANEANDLLRKDMEKLNLQAQGDRANETYAAEKVIALMVASMVNTGGGAFAIKGAAKARGGEEGLQFGNINERRDNDNERLRQQQLANEAGANQARTDFGFGVVTNILGVAGQGTTALATKDLRDAQIAAAEGSIKQT